MKKSNFKMLLSAALACTLTFAAGFGTYSLYAKKFISTGNTAAAARFDITPTGNTFTEKSFDVGKMQPGSDTKEFSFSVVKNNDTIKTETPVNYTISLKANDNDKALFENVGSYTSPINFKLMRKGSDGTYKAVSESFMNGSFTLGDDTKDMKPADVEDFKIICSWNSVSDEADTAYAGKFGKFDIVFNAKQTTEYVEPPYVPEIKTLNNKEVTVNMFKKMSDGKNFEWIIYTSKTTLNEIKYYKDKDGKRIVEFGDVTVKGWNTNNITIKNLKFAEDKSGSKQYVPSYTCAKDGWDNKVFTSRCSSNPRTGACFLSFEHVNDPYQYPSTDGISISIDSTELDTLQDWFN